MPKSNILDILNELQADSKRTVKLQILRRENNNELLKNVLKMCLNPYQQYYIKKIPAYEKSTTPSMTLEQALGELEKLSNRTLTGHAGIDHLKNILSSLHKDDATVVERIIKKDLRCGVADSTVNSIFKNLIPTYPCLLAKPYDEDNVKKITYPAYSQIKSDGVRVNIIIDDGVVSYRGRSGLEMDFLNVHDDWFRELGKEVGYSCVLDGEAVVANDGVILSRQTGNGIINKAIKGTITVEEATCVIFDLWDIIPLDEFKNGLSSRTYKQRFEELKRVFGSREFMSSGQKAHIIDTIIVNNIEEAQAHFQKCIGDGLEGTILKNYSGLWEDKRSGDLVKFKSEKECDLIITGWNKGTLGTKNENKMGSLIVESSDGLVVANISGFPDKLRDEITEHIEDYLGTIATVRYNTRIKSEEKGRENIDSLFLPRYIEQRLDKNKADGSETIL